MFRTFNQIANAGDSECQNYRLATTMSRLKVLSELGIRSTSSNALAEQSAMPAENTDAPNVRIIPPLIYLIGLAVGFLVTLWMPFALISHLVVWPLGGVLIGCGAVLAASAVMKFKGVGTTVRPDRAASALVIAGPYRVTRNPMYLGLTVVYLGIAIAGQSVWAIILLPLVLFVIQRYAIEPEEAFLRRRFGADYVGYTTRVRRWL
jgi:protein-S-isoprenylcysteine O-methyltransferase Ste14